MRSDKQKKKDSRASSPALRQPPLIEPLENRALFSALFPGQISKAYGFNQITFDNGTVVGNGAGQTIAIVAVDHDASLSADLSTFDAAFHLNDPGSNWNLSVVGETGGAVPAASTTTDELYETSLDVQWAHALAPAANILVVEASSSISSDLQTAAHFAAGSAGVSVVSMSYVSPEFTNNNDNFYETPKGHNGVTFVAASGDNGTVTYPSSAPGVVAVGGTSLIISDSSGTYGSESAWGGTLSGFGSGGGVSTIEGEPAYQRGVQSTGSRTTPDVSFYADPANGRYAIIAGGQQISVGGTSGGAPAWAALFAIADQGRALNGLSTLNSGTQTLPMLYALAGTPFYTDAFHDITTGSNGFGINAGPGYDMATGLGTPNANFIAQYLGGNVSIPEPKAEALMMLTLVGCFLKRPTRHRSIGIDTNR